MSGLYFHIPFCRQSCIYCNFYFKNGRKYVAEYTQALLKEVDLKLNGIPGEFETLYFGGGTPSYLGNAELQSIVHKLSDYVQIGDLQEFTLEANPDDMSESNLMYWKQLGVTRLSVGIQSFIDSHLKWMNRAHTAGEAEAALSLAHNMGFDLSVDILFGIPGSNNEQLLFNLDKAMSFQIQHLSCYGLTLEDKTPWKKLIKTKGYDKPDEQLGAEQFQLTMNHLRSKGWEQYEISNYCLPGKQAIHNSSYWKNKTYIGFGPSAHSYNGDQRCWNVADLNAYVEALSQGVLPQECEQLSQSDHFNEYVMTSLRTIWGMDLNVLSKFNPDMETTIERLNHYIEKGMIIKKGDVYLLTDHGKFYADALASDLFIV